jgi:aryl-alcohol dehydrogenase-like predicted oxidoreductase
MQRTAGTALALLRGQTSHDRRSFTTPRGALLVCSKAGYLPPALMAKGALPRAAAEEVVDGHCIHPDCLRVSLQRSLANLNLGTLDVLYLHNAAEAQLSTVGRAEFMRRLRAAFVALEGERAAGRIVSYGLATWDSLRVPAGHASFLDLQAMVDMAVQVGGVNHGLRYVQAPLSVAAPQALTARLHAARPLRSDELADGLTLLEAATRLGLGVIASGSLAEGDALADAGQVSQALLAEPMGSAMGRVRGRGAKLLHWARSAPLLTTALVGHKAAEHVAENAALVRVPPLSAREFEDVSAWLLPQPRDRSG